MLDSLKYKFNKINYNNFTKILLLEESDNNIYINLIAKLQENNYQVLIAHNLNELEEILLIHNITLIISEYHLINLSKNILPVILLFNEQDFNQVELYIKFENVVDYFFTPFNIQFLINRINFIAIPKTQLNTFEENLHYYLWELKLLNENKLNELINLNDNDNCIKINKLAQYVLYFSYILNLINNFFLNKQISFEDLFNLIINNITTQLCYFNILIKFNIKEKVEINAINKYTLYFFLYLYFLAEILKKFSENIEIDFKFFNRNNNIYCHIIYHIDLNNYILIYNQMFLERISLAEYIQEYLWEYWKRKINPLKLNNTTYYMEFVIK